jgi:hypothetical protein
LKGIVMTLLAEMVESQFGLAEWGEILKDADLEGAYTSLALYDDAELFVLVSVISQRSGMPQEDLIYSFGEFMFPAFHTRYPQLIDGASGFLDFLESIDSMIHVEVKKLYPDAITPKFEHQRISKRELLLKYHSKRKLCKLAEGLIAGAATHFSTAYTLKHDPCIHRGADYCGLLVEENHEQ